MSGDSESESRTPEPPARSPAGSPAGSATEARAARPSEPGTVAVPDRLLTSGYEFAIGIAATSVKMKLPLAVPAGLKPFLKVQKVPANAHARIRSAIEGDEAFRTAIGRAAATAPEVLDELSLLWLTRPEGWQARSVALVNQVPADDLAAELRRAERRREAAEAATHRVLAEVIAVRAELDRRTDVSTTSNQELERLRADLAVARTEVERHQLALRRAGEQTRVADQRTAEMAAERDAAISRAEDAERVRDAVLASRAAGGDVVGRSGAAAPRSDEAAVLAGAAAVAAALEDQSQVVRHLGLELDRLTRRLRELEPKVSGLRTAASERPAPAAGRGRGRGPAPQRTPIAVPGGLYGDSVAAAEHVVRHRNAVVIVDGYNVAKLRFPTLALEQQRERCIDLCEDVARRWGTNIVVVFDGTNASGIAGAVRRLVRVTYSPEGTIADDVIRAEVASLPADVPVVVVTNDQAIIGDVRAMGANPVSSDRFLELATR